MGIAIIIPDADFSAKNLGQVTITTESELTTITVTGNITVSGETATYGVVYNPGVPSAKKGVVYSITSGSQYASIDASTGVLTILSGASASAVTVKATSTYNNAIFGILDITVTYKEMGVLDLSAGIGIFLNSSGIDPYTTGGCVVFVGEMSENSQYGDNQYGTTNLTGSSVDCGRQSYYKSDYSLIYQNKENAGGSYKSCFKYEKVSTWGYKINNLIFSKTGGIFENGVSVAGTASTKQGGGQGNYIFGYAANVISTTDNTITAESLATAITTKKETVTLPNSTHRTIKVRHFLIFTEADYTTVEEALANRQYADIDLKFDENNQPYNGGTNQTVTFLTASYE